MDIWSLVLGAGIGFAGSTARDFLQEKLQRSRRRRELQREELLEARGAVRGMTDAVRSLHDAMRAAGGAGWVVEVHLTMKVDDETIATCREAVARLRWCKLSADWPLSDHLATFIATSRSALIPNSEAMAVRYREQLFDQALDIEEILAGSLRHLG